MNDPKKQFRQESNTEPAGTEPENHDAETIPPKSVDETATLPLKTGASPFAGSHAPSEANSAGSFGDYELLEEIARGGMGVVYKARQRSLNRIVALKMILSGQLASEEDIRRFYMEAEAAANLDHPGIVPIYEVGSHEGQHFFSMAYIEGQSLADRVAEGPLPPKEAAELVRKIANAVGYAHSHGVIHRDLKTGNILLDSNGEPKVTDFGLAKRAESDSNLTGTGQILGTPSYMPPEQAAGRVDEVGPPADVYSVGAILYCLLTGRPPFQAATVMDTLMLVLEQEPTPLRQLNRSVPKDLETICLKCLEKNAFHRYSNPSQIAEELQRFLDSRPIVARPLGTIGRIYRWSVRSKQLLSIATVSIVVAGVLVYFGQRMYGAHKTEPIRRSAEQFMAAIQARDKHALKKTITTQASTHMPWAFSGLRQIEHQEKINKLYQQLRKGEKDEVALHQWKAEVAKYTAKYSKPSISRLTRDPFRWASFVHADSRIEVRDINYNNDRAQAEFSVIQQNEGKKTIEFKGALRLRFESNKWLVYEVIIYQNKQLGLIEQTVSLEFPQSSGEYQERKLRELQEGREASRR